MGRPRANKTLCEAISILEADKLNLSDKELLKLVRNTIEVQDTEFIDTVTSSLETSLCTFAQETLSGPQEAPYNGRFLIGNHHGEWGRLIQGHNRLCILAPRDHGKSYFFDFAYPLWQISRSTTRGLGYIFSATQDQAVRLLGAIKNEIETNPKLQHLLPEQLGTRGRKWSSSAITTRNGYTIYARGYGTKVRGGHPDWIIVDDGLNDETAYSELVRRKQNDYFFTAISNMVTPNGQIIVVGTPFSMNDLYGELAKNSEYYFKKYQALNGPDEIPLWPERYSKEILLRKRREIGAVRFTRELQCDPISDDMSLFPLMLFQGEPAEQFNIRLGMPYKFWEQAGVVPYMGVDFAMSTSTGADYFVAWVMGLDKQGNRWIIDIQRGCGLPYQSQLSIINTLGRKYRPALIYLESNQMQTIYGDELIRTTDLPIKKFVTTAIKHSLDKGVPSLRVLLENKKMRIPRGDQKSIEMTDIWINEMRALTWSEGGIKSVSGHDDTVMGNWICDQAIRQGGFSFDFGDGTEKGRNLDTMLEEDNAEIEETEYTEEELEREIRETLGGTFDADDDGEEHKPKASGNLIDLDDYS
jgi:hypothetical protein